MDGSGKEGAHFFCGIIHKKDTARIAHGDQLRSTTLVKAKMCYIWIAHGSQIFEIPYYFLIIAKSNQ